MIIINLNIIEIKMFIPNSNNNANDIAIILNKKTLL